VIAAAWAWFSGTAVGRWIIAAGVVAAAIGGALLLGRWQGRQAAEQDQEAEQHEAYRDAVETRNSVEDGIRRAGDGTAASRLRDGWSRD
jgi:hypothetical protein